MHVCLTVQEVIDRIVDILSEDVAMMRRCGLISHIWTSRTRKYIFKEVHLRLARPSPEDGDLDLSQQSYRPEQLLSILQASPHLIELINTLHIIQREHDIPDPHPPPSHDDPPIQSVFDNPVTVTLLSIPYPSLHTIRLHQPGLSGQGKVFEVLVAALDRNQLPKLARFEMYRGDFDCEAFLRRASPFLQELIFRDAIIFSSGYPDRIVKSPIPFPQLRELRMEGNFEGDVEPPARICTSFRSPVLRKLSAMIIKYSIDFDEVWKMIQSVSGTLEFLFLGVSVWSQRELAFPDIWTCTRLRVLGITLSPADQRLFIDPWTINCLSFTLDALCNRGLRLPLETIFLYLTFCVWRTSQEVQDVADWELFDRVIVGFHSRAGKLKRVRLLMMLGQVTFDEACTFVLERLPHTLACRSTGLELELVIQDKGYLGWGCIPSEAVELWDD